MKPITGQVEHPQLGQVSPGDHHQPAYDLSVDAAGGGDFDEIDNAINDIAGAGVIYVKGGSYATFTNDEDFLALIFEPDVVVAGAATLSGQESSILALGDTDIQGLLTLSGAGATYHGFGATNTYGMLMSGLSANYIGGGMGDSHGGGTTRHGISITGAGCTVQNTRASTTAGSGNAFDGINVSGSDAKVSQVEVLDSDQDGVNLSGGQRSQLSDVYVKGSDRDGYRLAIDKCQLSGCISQSAGGDGFHVIGDNNQIIAGQAQDATGATIEFVAGADNNIAVGCRLGGSITDGGSGNVDVGNNTAAL